MKKIFEYLCMWLLAASLLLVNTASIIGIGVFLYNWGAVGLKIGSSAWYGFEWFMIQFAAGVVIFLFVVGIVYINILIEKKVKR